MADEADRMNHDAGSHGGHAAFLEDSAWDLMQDILGAFDPDGVAGVVATLIARHDVGLLGQNIHPFAFSFIAPLGSDNNGYLTHGRVILSEKYLAWNKRDYCF